MLLGFFVKTPPLVIDDLHFTPLNEIVSGKSFPDMYGVVIHANILSMILSGKYPRLASAGIAYLFAFLITLLFNFYILLRYNKKAHPSHLGFILVQIFSILLMLYFFLILYKYFFFKVALEPIMICMVLSLEMDSLYKRLALWLHKKYRYKTVFSKHAA